MKEGMGIVEKSREARVFLGGQSPADYIRFLHRYNSQAIAREIREQH